MEIGSIVVLKGHTNIEEKKYNNKPLLRLEDDAPTMVVKEKITNPKTKNLYNQEFGKQIDPINSKSKYFCIWYDKEYGQVKDGYFYENELFKISLEINNHGIDDFKIGSKVYLRNIGLELVKKYLYNIENKKYRFASPVMMVRDLKKTEKPIEFHTQKGIATKEQSEIQVKCKWFNSKNGKYSEEWFPMESLVFENFMEIDYSFLKNENDDTAKKVKNNPTSKCTMELIENQLNIKDSPYEYNKYKGKINEWAIFKSSNNIILSPIKNYLKKIGYEIEKEKLFVSENNYYGQIDFVVKDNNKEKAIFDIITSDKITSKDIKEWQSKKNNGSEEYNRSEEYNLLEKYWQRIQKHAEILQKQYSYEAVKCFLLIDNNKNIRIANEK